MSWLSKGIKKVVGKKNYDKLKGVASAVVPFVDPATSLAGVYGETAQKIAGTNIATGAVGASIVSGFGGFGGANPMGAFSVPSAAKDIYGTVTDLFKTYVNAKYQGTPPPITPTVGWPRFYPEYGAPYPMPQWGVGMPVQQGAPVPGSTIIFGGQPDTRPNQAIPNGNAAPIVIASPSDAPASSGDNKTLLIAGGGFAFLVLMMFMLLAGRK